MPLPALEISPLLERKLDNFRQNRRGYYSLWAFLFLFAVTLPAEFIANDTPLLIKFEGKFYYPILSPIRKPLSVVISRQNPTTRILIFKSS